MGEPSKVKVNGRPVRVGKSFRCFRDPSRKHFGFIDKLVVSFTDGQQPFSECMTVAQFNKRAVKS